MSSTRKQTIIDRYGPDFWSRIAKEGGKKTPASARGFSDPEVASRAGKKSKRKSLRSE